MRFVEYETLHRGGGSDRECISVSDLLRAIPYLLTGGLVPPIHVANELLRLGGFNAGMSGAGKWAPFEVDEAEYREVVEDLVNRALFGRTLRYEKAPDWVCDGNEFRIWVAERVYSIPAEENRKFDTAMRELDARMKEAEARGDEEAREDCLCHLSKLSIQHSEFMQKHRKPRAPGA